MPKISIKEYAQFHVDYYNTNIQLLRYGQAFFNQFLTHDEEVDNLFYETDTRKVIETIYLNYIDYNVN